MTDTEKLLDISIPLQARYDKFALWMNQNATVATNIMAEKLGVKVAHVEAFMDIGLLDPDEFPLIDSKKITVDFLVLILKEDKHIRMKIYKDYSLITKCVQPMKALKEYIEKFTTPNVDDKVHQINPKALSSIASYCKLAGIDRYPITIKFRKFIVDCARVLAREQTLSSAQINWIVEAIIFDYNNSLRVFTNKTLQDDFPEDVRIFMEIAEDVTNLNIS